MDTEYAYINTRNGRVVGLQPADKPLSAVLDSADYDVVLNRLVEAGWEPVNPNFRPAAAGDSLIRLKREASFVAPTVPDDLRLVSVEVRASPEEFDVVVAETRHLYEVNGWDLLKIWGQGGLNFGPRLFFSKPKSAPDVTPFVDPNRK
jgi:hypothetical protein